jgi:hypothetical protein
LWIDLISNFGHVIIKLDVEFHVKLINSRRFLIPKGVVSGRFSREKV